MAEERDVAVVRRFVRTGDAACLDDLTNSFNKLYVRGREGYLDLSDATLVMEHLLRILSRGTDPITELGIFLCMQRLTSLATNEKHCFALLDKFQVHSARDELLDFVTRTTTSTEDVILLHHCFEFTMYFLIQSCGRQEILYNNDQLIKAILPYCTGGLRVQPTLAKCDLLQVLGSMLHLDMAECGKTQSIDCPSAENQVRYLTKFLKWGGLKAVLSLSTDVISARADSGFPDQYAWSLACNVLRNLLCKLCVQQFETVPQKLCLIERSDLPALTRALYVRLQEGPHPMPYLIVCIGGLGMYLSYYGYPDLENVLFYRGESGTEKSFLRVHLESAAVCRDAYTEGGALAMMEMTKVRLPELTARIDAEMQLVVKEDKDRHCANPGFTIGGKGLMGAQMMKCGRCLAVHYCSKEHQKEHWSVHKRSCKSPK
jgi:hypothetical protein